MTTSSITHPLPTITLSENERTLAQLLVECADWVEQNPQQVDELRLKDEDGDWIGKLRGTEPVELRIAGGWVRDKLLGKESDDIDISTSPDPITGLKFATLFEKYLDTLGKRHLMGKLTKIEAKPEQSKHLETATARVCDLSVDWVQQRGQEVYNEGSRIPTVAFGSPLEDAERRDLTINALFYNLRTRQIEDQTTKGLSDLGFVPGQPKRIRTPLEPFQTFRDDPLRVVRAVRFAARFGRDFELDDEMVRAIEREEIRQALLDPKKISRERVGAELDKMLLGKDPCYAFELIERLHLYPLVFLYDHSSTFISPTFSTINMPPPTKDEFDVPPLPDTTLSVSAAKLLTSQLATSAHQDSSLPALHPLLTLHVVDPPPLPPHSSLPPYPEPTPLISPPNSNPSASSSATTSTTNEQSVPLATIYPHTLKRLYLSCGLLPLYPFSSPDKKKVVWVGEKVVRDGIKGPSVDIAWVKKSREGAKVVGDMIKERFLSNGEDTVRSEDNVDVQERDAKDRVEIGMLLRNPSVHDGQHIRWNVTFLWSLIVDLVHARTDHVKSIRIVEAYNRFVERILELNLHTKAFDPPLLDGKAINLLLPSTRSSPAMVQILHLVTSYQLANPLATREQVEQWLMTDQQREMIEGLCQSFKRDSAAGTKRKGNQR